MYNDDLGDSLRRQQILKLVEQFEKMLKSNNSMYFSVEEFEDIVEYYESYFEFGKALKVVLHAESIYRYVSFFRVKKAQLLIELKQYKRAFHALEEAEILSPLQIEIQMLRAEIYANTNHYKEAICELREALGRADKVEKVDIYMAMSDIYDSISNNQMAYKCLEKALALQPDHETALSRIDYFVEQDQCYAKSICLHEKIIDRVPYCYLAWYNLGNAYFALHQYDKAIEAYDYVTAINEKYDLAYRNTGHAYFLMGNYERAKQNFIEASAYDDEPDDELYYYIALCYHNLAEIDNTLLYIDKCLGINPANHQALFLKGQCCASMYDYMNALDLFDQTLRVEKNDHRCMAAIANIHHELENFEMAITFYQYAIAQCPEQLDYYRALALIYIDQQRPNEALSLSFAAMGKSEKEMPQFCYLAALALFAGGCKKQALDYCAKGLAEDFDAHQILYNTMPALLLNNQLKALVALYQP